MNRNKLILILILAAILVSCAQSVKYEVKNCSKGLVSGYVYYPNKRLLDAYVIVNCCSDEIKVVREGDLYKILEKDYDGKICRCVCEKEVLIYGVPQSFNVSFVDYLGEVHKLKNLGKFCGISTFGKCRTDEDCIVTGCSNQVCAAKGQSIFTTCEWKMCYDARIYHMACRCVNGHCRWTQT